MKKRQENAKKVLTCKAWFGILLNVLWKYQSDKKDISKKFKKSQKNVDND